MFLNFLNKLTINTSDYHVLVTIIHSSDILKPLISIYYYLFII